jgi:hypothetical protein
MVLMILININNIPNIFKKSTFYINMIDNDSDTTCIYVPAGYDNFNASVNDFNDIKRLLNLYKFWAVSDMIIYDLIYNNKKLILNNINQFIEFNDSFKMLSSFITLLKPIDIIYSEIVKDNNLNLLKYLCEKHLITSNISKYIVKNLNCVELLREYNVFISYYNILKCGISNKNIDYLKYLIKYHLPFINRNVNKIINICCKNKANNWIDYFINNYTLFSKTLMQEYIINFNNLCEFAAMSNNLELFTKLISENRVEINTEMKIINFIFIGKKCPKILEWIIKNKMSLNYILRDIELIFNKYTDIYDCLIYNDDNFVTENFSDFTLGKFLQLASLISNNEVYLMRWLLKNNIGKSTAILNRAAFWWKAKNFIWLYNQGYSFDQHTLKNAINGNEVDTVRFLMDKGCIINATYQTCNLAYNNDNYEMLKFLTSKELNLNFDNRYIIKSIIDNDYSMFVNLYRNYSDISNYNFTNENNELYNKRLKLFIDKFNIFINYHP